jgi:hypothetical protein
MPTGSMSIVVAHGIGRDRDLSACAVHPTLLSELGPDPLYRSDDARQAPK